MLLFVAYSKNLLRQHLAQDKNSQETDTIPGPGEVMNYRDHGFLSTSSGSGTVISASCFLQSNSQNHPQGKGSDGHTCNRQGLGPQCLCIETVLGQLPETCCSSVNGGTDGQKKRFGTMDLSQGSGPGQVGYRGGAAMGLTHPIFHCSLSPLPSH